MRPKQSKSDRIRAYAAKHPDAGPSAIVAALAAKGVAVVPGHVVSALRANGGKAKRRTAEPSVETLLLVKRLADKLGRERLRWALGALERLGVA